MASVKLKTTYVFFFASSIIWLSLFFYVCFPSGVWATQIRFPNSSVFVLFFGSATVATISCTVIGLDYMGLNFKLRQGPGTAPQTPKYFANVAISQSADAVSIQEVDIQNPARQEDTVEFSVLPQLKKNRQLNS